MKLILILSMLFLLTCKSVNHSKESSTSSKETCSFLCDEIPDINSSYVFQDEEYRLHHEKDTFKVMSWNILKGMRPSWEGDFKKFQSDANVILLQEAMLIGKIVKAIPKNKNWGMALSFKQEEDQKYTGVMNISSFIFKEKEQVRSKGREPFAKTPKMILATKYHMPDGRILLAINIHGINFVMNKNLKNQIEKTEELIKNHIGPIIFSGDFNTWNSGRTNSVNKFMEDNGLQRVEFKNDNRKFLELDRFYYRDLILVESNLIQELDSSDHPIMMLEFSIKAPK